MADQSTCGQGLAEHSALPVKLGELAASLAHNLEVHMTALDLSDETARKEHAVYQRLVQQHQAIAAELRTVGQEMADQHDLPMGKHDQGAMSSPNVAEAFETFVTAEKKLLALLQERVEEDDSMLVEMQRDSR
jgi:uncharacterized protein involved in exopolysaccharide biosynthesis